MNPSIKKFLFISALAVIVYACAPAKGNRTGHEFMPDMSHNIGYEANTMTYYYYNRWGTEADYRQYAMPRLPVKGTIPRGFAGGPNPKTGNIAITQNGHVPYYYNDTEEDRIRATANLIHNPYPITDAGLARAKNLYTVYCGICHGEKADGNGFLVRDGSPYPAQPANLVSDEFTAASNGRFYHAIMYGKNVMGSHADKLSFEERWQVIHYIRSLQAASRNLKYNEKINTLNGIDRPGALRLKSPDPALGDTISTDSTGMPIDQSLAPSDTLHQQSGH